MKVEVEVEVEEGLALDTFKKTAFAFRVFVANIICDHAWRLNKEAECHVMDDTLDSASVTDLWSSYFVVSKFVVAAQGDWQGALAACE